MQMPSLGDHPVEDESAVVATVSPTRSHRRPSGLRLLTVLVACAAAIWLSVYLWQEPRYFDMRSSSMEPTLMGHEAGVNVETAENYHDSIHDHILVSGGAYRLRRPEVGDIVLFRAPKQADVLDMLSGNPQQEVLLIQRIVGIPGDTLHLQPGTVMQSGTTHTASILYRNGKPVDEWSDVGGRGFLKEPMYSPQASNAKYGIDQPITMGAADYFVMGDNRNVSNDSRQWGTIDRQRILGKVKSILDPPERRRSFE